MTTTAGTGASYVAVTPSDTGLVGPCMALYVGVTGDVAVKYSPGGASVVFKSVPVGAAIVMSTGTTATNIVAIF